LSSRPNGYAGLPLIPMGPDGTPYNASLKSLFTIAVLTFSLLSFLAACGPTATPEHAEPVPMATFAPTPTPAFTVIQFGTTDSDFASDMAIDRAGNVYVVGTIDKGALPGQTSLGEVDAYVRKYDVHGNEIWTRQFGTQSQDHASGVRVDGAGNVYVVGFTRGALTGETNLGSSDVYLRKYDGDGSELWTRQFGTEGMDMANGIAIDRTGNVYVVGFTLGSDRGREGLPWLSPPHIRCLHLPLDCWQKGHSGCRTGGSTTRSHRYHAYLGRRYLSRWAGRECLPVVLLHIRCLPHLSPHQSLRRKLG